MGDDKLDRIELKIDTIVDRISAVDITLAKQHEQLAYHIRRTDMLEAEFKPVSEHVGFIKVAGRILTAGASAGAILHYWFHVI